MIAIPNMDMPEHCYECLLRQGNCCLLLYEATPPTVPLTRLDDCPLIDIVTCGECKWSYTDERDGTEWCKVHTSHYRVNSDGFCKYGERRSDESDRKTLL